MIADIRALTAAPPGHAAPVGPPPERKRRRKARRARDRRWTRPCRRRAAMPRPAPWRAIWSRRWKSRARARLRIGAAELQAHWLPGRGPRRTLAMTTLAARSGRGKSTISRAIAGTAIRTPGATAPLRDPLPAPAGAPDPDLDRDSIRRAVSAIRQDRPGARAAPHRCAAGRESCRAGRPSVAPQGGEIPPSPRIIICPGRAVRPCLLPPEATARAGATAPGQAPQQRCQAASKRGKSTPFSSAICAVRSSSNLRRPV